MGQPTEKDMYDFVKGHYYCDDDCKEKWEPFEHWDDDAIEDQIDTDVQALKNFLAFHYNYKEVPSGPTNV